MSDAASSPAEANGFAVVREMAIGRGAVTGMAMSPDGGMLTVTHHGDDCVSLITTTHRAATLTVTDVEEPVAVATSGQRAYVSTVATANDEVLALDTDSEYIVASYPVDFSVTDLAVSPGGRHVYVGRTGEDGASIVVLDTHTGARRTITVAAAAIGCVRVSANGRWVYVAANGATSAELVLIDTRRCQVAGTIEISSPIRDIALGRDGATAYVASCGPDFDAVLDVVDIRNSAVDATYKIGGAASTPAQFTVSRSGERAYLVGDEQVTVLSTATHDIVGSIEVADQPSCVVESPAGDRLYIADYAGTVTTLEIAPAAGLTADGELTSPGAWSYSDLLMLEPTPA